MLADAERLTVVVGAGASAEAGLPTWIGLLNALLDEIGTRELSASGAISLPAPSPTGEPPPTLTKDDRHRVEQFRDWCLRVDGQLGAGAIVRAATTDDEFEQMLASELYRNVGSNPLPGPTARGIVRLKELWGDRCQVITTNYDLLLEAAFLEIGQGDVQSAIDGSEFPNSIVVRHVHGVCTKNGVQGQLIFAEGDYHRMQDGTWQEEQLTEALCHSACLFVGASMSDPNLLRYLYRSKLDSDFEGGKAVALLVRQADPWEFADHIDPSVREARAAAVRRRWESAGVMPIQADYFVQSSQFVYELARVRDQGGSYVEYEDRLDLWEAQIEDSLLNENDIGIFQIQQDKLQALLRRWLQDIVEILTEDRVVDGEELALQLWVRDPSTRSIVHWASSDRAWRDPGTLPRHRVARPTSRLAVEAFCMGNPVDASLVGMDSRWNFLRAVPIFIEDEEWGRLPVGVLTMSSTSAKSDSILYPEEPDSWDLVLQYVSALAVALLTP